MKALVLALELAGLVLAIVEEVIARGRSLLGWAVVCLALALILPRVF